MSANERNAGASSRGAEKTSVPDDSDRCGTARASSMTTASPSEETAGPVEWGVSRAMDLVGLAIDRVAATPRTTVLITGESGVGKEIVAREIHRRSARRDKPFVAVNCAGLADGLLEADLFGYAPG